MTNIFKLVKIMVLSQLLLISFSHADPYSLNPAFSPLPAEYSPPPPTEDYSPPPPPPDDAPPPADYSPAPPPTEDYSPPPPPPDDAPPPADYSSPPPTEDYSPPPPSPDDAPPPADYSSPPPTEDAPPPASYSPPPPTEAGAPPPLPPTEADAPPPPPATEVDAPAHPPNTLKPSGHKSRTIVIIVVIVVATIVVLVIVLITCCIFRKRTKQKPRENIQNNDEISTVESLQYDFGKIGSAILLITCCIFRKRTKQKPRENIQNNDEISTVESLQYDFGKIRSATNYFSDENKLGEGGFGAVYKGRLENGREIAVKRLSKNSGQGDLEFKNEVLLLSRLQHRNLVRLLGFSLEGEEKLLVYEFVQNASLDQFIFDPVKRSVLDWDRRSMIVGGIARGLLYLHEDSRLRIIHRDLKASNVLLDSEMKPKIADFGMARLFIKDDQTRGSTRNICGTYGYMAPEYANHGQFSMKSDVFSFGVMLLEIVSGQRNNSLRSDGTLQDLLSITWKNWRDGTAVNIIDPILKSASGSIRDMLRFIHIGLLCVQDNVADRPTMASVVLMLSSLSFTLASPSEPPFFVQGYEIVTEDNTKSESDQKKLIYASSSKNYASIKDLYPR